MKKWTSTLSIENRQDLKNSPFLQDIFTENSIFFDIETTGFSPANTQLYLIGCATRKGFEITIEQYFAEDKQDEKQLLISFLELLEDYQIILTFNGIGFDIPSLKAKCNRYQLMESFSDKKYIDLFKIVSGLKFLFKLPNYKQKTIEDFLGIHRNDTFNGGELIQVYQEYVQCPNEQQLFLLKQHNYEDVLGMFDLLPILSYHHFITGGYTISSIESNLYIDYDGIEQKELLFSLVIETPLPKRVSCCFEGCYLTAAGNEAKLKIPLFEGELKFFFHNYKDYYYLPIEDTAIHKDVAAYVDKAHRKKATATTCYTRKESIFLPQYELIVEPAFRKQLKDKISYFELTDDFIQSDLLLQNYIQHIFSLICASK